MNMPDLHDPLYRDASLADAAEPYESAPEWFYWFWFWASIAAAIWCATSAANADTPILMNLAAPYGWLSSDPFTDKANLCRPYGSPAAPWDESVPLASYVNGYPVGDFGGYLDCAGLKAGTYDVTFKGTGRIAWSNATASTATTVDLASGRPVWFSVTGTNRADPFRDFHVIRHGDDPAKVFTDDFLADLRGVACVRMMDWGRTNEIQPQTFAQRQTPAGTQTTTRGVALEHQIALANALGADLWLCLPDWADDAYVAETAKMVAAGLDKKLNVYVEVSNECWNGQFPQFNRLLTAAQNNPELSAVDRYERLYQHVGFRSRAVGKLFRDAGFATGNRVRPILAGQAVNAWWVDSALKFLDAKYGAGTAADVVWAVAYADYWRPSYAQETTSPTLDNLLASLAASVVTDAAANLMAHKATGAKYGVNRVVTYEGGEHVTDRVYSDSGASQLLNHALHLAMQRDPRMGVAYKVGIDQFFKGGGTMWGAYCSTSSWGTGEWGYWGLGETLADDTPKRQAVRGYYATAIPPPVVPVPSQRPTPWNPATRPSFPIAQWEVPAKNMDAAKAHGVNVLVSAGLEGAKNKATKLVWAAEAAKRGLWVIADFEGDVPANAYALLLPDEFDAKQADPAVQKWDGLTHAQLRPKYDAFKALAPDLPVFASLSGDHVTREPGRITYYKSIADCCDIWSEDWYPYTIDPTRYPNTLKVQAIGVLKAAAPDKPVWSVQETDWQNLKDRPNGRQITADELRQSIAGTRAAGIAGREYFTHVFNGQGGWVDWDRTPADVWAVATTENAKDSPAPTTQPTTQPTDPVNQRVAALEQQQGAMVEQIGSLTVRLNQAEAAAAAANNVWDAMVKARQAATQPSGGTK